MNWMDMEDISIEFRHSKSLHMKQYIIVGRCDIIGTAKQIEAKEAQMHNRLARKPSFKVRSLSMDKTSGNSTSSGQSINSIYALMALNVLTTSSILVKFCMSSSRAGAQDFPIICITKSAYDLKSKTPFSACCLIRASSSTSFICCKLQFNSTIRTK
ncbi:hypothetical protein GQX74_001465 [Glossina fuscipes]|nr:hypothetical protein GQX74_001465 [Glossina fuscipes]